VQSAFAPIEREPRGTLPIILAGGHILDLENSALQGSDVLIENGAVARIAPHGTIASPVARQLDASGCLILPGITNAHTHSPENMAAGFCDGLQLDDWLKAIWAQLDHMTPDAVRLAVFAGAALMLKRGVTAVVDHFRQTPASLPAIDSARAAYAATGMRAMIAVMLRDRVADNGQMVGVASRIRPISIPEARELWTEVTKRNDPRSRVTMALGPSGPTRCSDEMFELAVEIAQRHSLCLHTHVAETRSCAENALQLFGCRTVRHLADLGFLGPRTSLAHCVWIDDEEIDLIARSRTVAVHNPISNMVLGTGVAPVPAMLAAGARVAVGTDGAASNGGQDIFESIKCAALLARNSTPNAGDWLTASKAMKLAVNGGREIFSLAPPAIVPDVVADIAVFPFAEDTLDNFFDPVRQLVYGAQSRARHVLVAGEPVVVDGEITSFDDAALQAELRQIRKKFMPSN
jgi:5-methylthioadenosine/S-adenosylhomocysteine deaminase